MCICVFPGYTVSSVMVGDWRRLYVAGAPRFKHKGKVILFELSDEGDVNIVQALNGEQVKLYARITSLPLGLLFTVHGRTSHSGTSAPSTGDKVKNHVFVCRLGLTMAVKFVGWILTKMASLMSFWLLHQCTSAQETRRLAESTSTPSVG